MNLKKIGLFAIAMIMTLFSFQTYSFAAEEMEWVKKAPMPTARYYVGGVVYDNKIYVYGGTSGYGTHDIFEMYDPEKNEWQTLPSSSLARNGVAFVENQGKFYAMGGSSDAGPTNLVEVFDPLSNQWTSAQSMPTPLRYVNGVSLDNNIYIFGGQDQDLKHNNLVYSFNPKTNSWITRKPMPFKGSSVPFIKDNSIYVIHNNYNEEKITIYLYDHVQDTWTQIDESPSQLGVDAAFTYGGKIFFLNQTTLSHYDESTKTFETLPVDSLNNSGYAFGIVNGKLSVIGGAYSVNGHTAGPTSDVMELNLSDLVNPEPNPNPDPNPNPTGNVLLVIYMDSGLIKEYEMTNEEIRNFTEWYEGRAKGNGREAYIVNKKYNIGPFNSRKDFISYSHIESFEVQEYSR
ncbi:Kelch repeat-containing protein [Brevibacillus laterosporus]|uniref:Kelch repeat-containing protein n=1 Tax=Brevibacillus laterosporus TaxID=1465 RepID=UPI0018F888B9|nr:kelch repeat-containing protein [Brevibacillus laterosporus]MBG9774087.1 galactose oxidase [Brevibacillus laterosporus]